jgi:hypothetical protein
VVGELVGLSVGLVVGELVGLEVGELVGLWVGLPVGELVGLWVGLVVGDCVGLNVGLFVGVVGKRVGDIVNAAGLKRQILPLAVLLHDDAAYWTHSDPVESLLPVIPCPVKRVQSVHASPDSPVESQPDHHRLMVENTLAFLRLRSRTPDIPSSIISHVPTNSPVTEWTRTSDGKPRVIGKSKRDRAELHLNINPWPAVKPLLAARASQYAFASTSVGNSLAIWGWSSL